MLDRLQELIDTAAAGGQVFDDTAPLPRTEISESRFSLLENSLKRHLAERTLSATIPAKQKETIQSLISDIAHQMLTPISNLKLYSELLMEQSGGWEEEIFTIHEQAEKLDFLIRSLVMLSRMETGILNIHAQDSYVKELFDTVSREYAPLAAAKHISWSCTCDSSLSALFDLKWTAEALGNIADNAVKYTQDGGRITISAEKYTFFVRIDIADNGIGILEEEQSRIFTRFYRSPAVSDRPGVGIGLYLAQQRVAIARAILTKPAVLLADEPTGNLDSRTSQDVLGLLKGTQEQFHQTIVMITHNEEIAQLSDRILHLEDGRIISGQTTGGEHYGKG